MTLSLWQQGTCVKSAVVNDRKLRVEILYMRPIFSGATKDSNNDHKIQWWINKWGTQKQELISVNTKRLLLAEDQEDEIGAVPEAAGSDLDVVTSAEKQFYFSPNGTNTYTN